MSTHPPIITKKLIKNLEPLASLSPDKLDELIAKSTVEELPAGRVLFRQGEKDKQILYLIAGQIELTAHGKLGARVIKAKSSETRKPLVPEYPRSCSARTKTPATLFRVDSDLLEILLNDKPLAAYEVTDLSENADESSEWMFRFLQSPAFLALPTDNIQSLLMRMEERPAKKGEQIVRQGDDDDFYYIIKQGRCRVTRRPSPKAQAINLAMLEAGDGFGEEALITGAKRNATIIMAENGVLMRLPKDDFIRLLVTPLLKQTSAQELPSLLNQGAILVDVRGPEAFSHARVPGAVNLPLTVLRLKLAGLDPNRTYVVYCDDGSRSAAAAFLMSQQGLQVLALRGGIPDALRTPSGRTTTSPAATNTPLPPVASPPKRAPVSPKTAAPPAGTTDKTSHAGVQRINAEYAQRMAVAEQARQEANTHAQRLKTDARTARKAAEAETARLAHRGQAPQGDVQAIRLRAEAEAQRAEAAEATLKRTETALTRLKVEAEAARKAAERQATERAKTDTQARLKAEQEVERLRAEATQLMAERTEIESRVRREAEKQASHLRAEAERLMAKRTRSEAAARLKAEQEAEHLRAEAERLTVERTETESRVRREASEQAKRLRAAAEQLMADREATEVRAHREAEQEAGRLRTEATQLIAERTAAETTARRAAEQEAERLRAEAEHLIAERTEGEARLRREALAEIETAAHQAATQARREGVEETRQLFEKETQRKQIEVEAARQQAAAATDQARTAEAARLVAERETRRLREEADAIRRQAQEEAETIRETATREAMRQQQEHTSLVQEALEAARQQAAEDARRARTAEAAQHHAEEHARHIVSVADEHMKKADQARQLAQTIATRLKAVDQRQTRTTRTAPTTPAQHTPKVQHTPLEEDIPPLLRQNAAPRVDSQTDHTGLRRIDNKIILEGEEDIFVFIEPHAADEDFTPPARGRGQSTHPTNSTRTPQSQSTGMRGAPSARTANPCPVHQITTPPLSDPSIALRAAAPVGESAHDTASADNDIPLPPTSHRRGLGAIAAGLLLMVGAAFVVSQVPWRHLGSQLTPATATVSVPTLSTAQQTARAAQTLAARSRAKAEVVHEAESEFSQLIRTWRNKLNSMPLFKHPAASAVSPAASRATNSGDNSARAPQAVNAPSPAPMPPSAPARVATQARPSAPAQTRPLASVPPALAPVSTPAQTIPTPSTKQGSVPVPAPSKATTPTHPSTSAQVNTPVAIPATPIPLTTATASAKHTPTPSRAPTKTAAPTPASTVQVSSVSAKQGSIGPTVQRRVAGATPPTTAVPTTSPASN